MGTPAAPQVGQPLVRREDVRFLTGTANYVDDIQRPGLLHAVVVRSSMAHALIRSIDVSQARAQHGVVGVFTAADLGGADPQVIPLWIKPMPGFDRFLQPTFAKERVRFVGEPVALVVAEDRYLAEDAADLVEVDYEHQPRGAVRLAAGRRGRGVRGRGVSPQGTNEGAPAQRGPARDARPGRRMG